MFSPLRSVAICCLTLALPAPVLAQASPGKAETCLTPGGCTGSVVETLVLDPSAKQDKKKDTISINAKNPTVAPPIDPKDSAPPTKAPDPVITLPVKTPEPVVRPPRPIPNTGVVLPAKDPGIAPTDPGFVPITPGTNTPIVDASPGIAPTGPGFVPFNPGVKTPVVDATPGTDAKPVEEMPYITFAPAAEYGNHEVSIVDSVRGTGRIRVSTDYGPVFCSGFVFGPTIVATSYVCVPGVLEDPRSGVNEIEEIRIVFDHIFPDQRLWTAQGYVLRLDTELSSRESGLAILHIADPDQSFSPDRIQRVGRAVPDSRAPLFMLSHPRGGTMQFHHCNAVDRDPAYLPAKAFEHTCASDLGDLGAPIFDGATGAVVGMHLSHELSSGRRFATTSLDLANWIGDQQ
jgi:hypothetical protein